MDIRYFWPTAKWRPTGRERKRAKLAWKNNLRVLKRSVGSQQSSMDKMDALTAEYQRKISMKFFRSDRKRLTEANKHGWVSWCIYYETGHFPIKEGKPC
jgi:hypothetical protein